MRLKRLEIRGFGRLRGSYPLDAGEGGVALLLERNEAGKTTLSAAILAALYGLDSDRRRARDRMVEREVYRPWEGGAFGLALYLERDGDELVIERDFERDVVRVLHGGSDVTDRFRQGSRVAVGEVLLGLSREQFTRSAFVAQGEVVWSSTEGLTEALQRLADTRSGESTAAAAIAALDAALASYEGVTLKGRGRVETEIDRCRQALSEQREQLDQLTRQREALSQRIDDLARRDEHSRASERRRLELRHEKARGERASLQARLDNDDERRQKVAGLQQEVAAAAVLLSLGDGAVRQAETAYANLQGARKALEGYQKESDQASDQRRRAVAARAEAGLRRRPTEADRDTLHSALVRVQGAQAERARFGERLQSELADLRVQGFELEQAQGLARAFAGLSEDDRMALFGRNRAELQSHQQAQELAQQESQLKQARIGIREGQQTRKHLGIWLMIVGMLPVLVGLSMHAILPFSPLLLHGPGVLAIVVGIVVYLTGTGHRKREDQELRRQVDRLREQSASIEAQQQERAAAWAQLAARVGSPQDELEVRYRQLRSVVEPALDRIQRLQERLADLDAVERDALASCARASELFDEAASSEALADQLELVGLGFEAWREADAAEAALKRATWQVEEGKHSVGRRQAETWHALAACGVILPDTAPIEDGVRMLRERVVEATRIRQLRDVTLPELQASLLTDDDRARRVLRLAEVDAELARMEQAHGPLRAAGVLGASGLSIPARSAAELDAELERLEAQEREAARTGEAERAEARAFLSRYEAEAPALMEGIAEKEAALQRALEFREAVLLARDTLQRISKETHRDWAAALNRTTQELLVALASDVRELRFDERLGLQMRQGQQLLTGVQASQQLSAGALDSVYLAARLGVSRLLSGGLGPLPLILDRKSVV